MKPIDTNGLDQEQFSTLNEQLKLHAANLRGLLANAEGETIQQPTLSKPAGSDFFADMALLTSHINELEHRIGATCPTFRFFPAASLLAGSTAPLTFAASTPAAGIAAVVCKGGAAKSPTMTDRILAAKGVKTLAELNAKCAGVSAETDSDDDGRDDGDEDPDSKRERQANKSRVKPGKGRDDDDDDDARGGGKAKTMTEQILAANGVKTIAELNAKCAGGRTSHVTGD